MVNLFRFTFCTSLVLLIIGLALLFFHRPLISSQIEKQFVLVEGQEAFNLWFKPPVPFYLDVYIFNITNPDWYTKSGEKLVVNEVGPYVFKEIRTRKILNRSNDEITFIPISNYEFLPEQSGGLKLTDPFTTMNIPLVTLLALKENSFLLPKTEMYPYIENFLKSFVKTNYTEKFVITKTVDELVLGGYEPEVFVKIKPIAKRTGIHIPLPFNILWGKNNSENAGEWTVKTGVNDPSRLNQICRWKRKDFLAQWQPNSPCSKLKGVDGVLFHPGIHEQSKLDVFLWEACRSLPFNFAKHTQVKGVSTLRFAMDKLYDSGKQVDTCYCLADRRQDCWSDGLVEISTCTFDSPIIISKPHFLNVKDDTIKSIVGITQANESLHGSFLDIEPWTGAPLNGKARLQLNLHFNILPKYGLKVKKQMVPLLWSEARAQVDQETVSQLNGQLFSPLKLLNVTSFVVIGSSFVLPILFAVYFFSGKKNLFPTVGWLTEGPRTNG